MSSIASASRDWWGINAAVEMISTLASITIASNARFTSVRESTKSRRLIEMPTNTRPSGAADAPTGASAKSDQSAGV
jgi:hypothetical protein